MREILSKVGLSAGRRRKRFKKLGFEGYVDWIIQESGVWRSNPDKEELFKDAQNRKDVDKIISSKTIEEETPVTMAEKPVEGGIVFVEDVKIDEELDSTEDSEEVDIEPIEEEEVVKPSWVEAAEEVIQEQVELEPEPEPEPEPEVKQVIPIEQQLFVPDEVDYNSMTVRELQKVCKERNITIRGTKAEVVLRLKRHDEGLLGDTVDDEIETPSQEAVDVELDAPSQEAVTEGEKNATDSKQGEFIDEEE